MEMATLEERFGLRNRVAFFEGEGQRPYCRLTHAAGTAVVSLYGGHVLSYQPAGQPEVMWLSPLAEYVAGKAIRGGVPVIWPWFGPHPTDAAQSSHGFARRMMWTVTGAGEENGRLFLTLTLPCTEETLAIWPHRFELTLTIWLDTSLEIQLTTVNRDAGSVDITDALHTYFAVADVRQIEITGLEGADYLDNLAQWTRRPQFGPVTFAEEVDRIYVATTAVCTIHDPVQGRVIEIDKRGSHSTVVWNPWSEKAAGMGDFPDDGYLNMVCVETANAGSDLIRLAPDASHTLTQLIRSRRLG